MKGCNFSELADILCLFRGIWRKNVNCSLGGPLGSFASSMKQKEIVLKRPLNFCEWPKV